MSGSREGGLKAAQTNKERHGADFYAKIGSKGGKSTAPGVKKGFAVDDRNMLQKIMGWPSKAQRAGRKGGQISKRRKANENL